MLSLRPPLRLITRPLVAFLDRRSDAFRRRVDVAKPVARDTGV